MRAQSKPAVRPGKTLEQPASEKPRSTCDQDALSAHLLPQRLASRENAIEIVRQPVGRFCVVHVCVTWFRGSCLLGSLRQLCSVNSGGGPWDLMESLRHVIDHRLRDSGIEADPKNVVHYNARVP